MATKAKKASKPKTPEPRQVDLPGMENRKLADLRECALEYAEKRDERTSLLQEEVELKQRLLGLMKKHGKEEYAIPQNAAK